MQFFFFFVFFFIKASLFLHLTITSQTNTCHTCIFTGDHVVVGEKMLEYTFLMGNSLHTGVHDITDNILNHTYIYIVEIYSTQVSNLGKRSSHMHVEV